MEKTIICKSCGAEFSDMLSECPYCGTMNYKGAEAEYLGKLENVRADMEELCAVPKQEQKKELRRQLSFWLKVFLVIGCVAGCLFAFLYWRGHKTDKASRENYLWISQNAPKLDKLYEAEEYDALQELYFQYVNEERPVGLWQHSDFMNEYNMIVRAEELLQKEAAGDELSEVECISLFYWQWAVKGLGFCVYLDKDELVRLEELGKGIPSDIEARWGMSEEEYAVFCKRLEENHGTISYTECDEYIKEWYTKK